MAEVLSMLLYVSVLVLCWGFARLAEKKSNPLPVWLIVFVLSLLAGLRHETVGIDTASYVTKYAAIAEGHFELAYALEESFKYICYGLSRITPHPTLMLTIMALLTHACVLVRLWELRPLAAFSSMTVFYYAAFFFISLNCMRQFCAIAIVFFASRYLNEKKIMRFMLLVFVAMLFHRSAALGLVLLVFVALRWKELLRWQKVFFCCVAVVLPVGAVMVLRRYWDNFQNIELNFGLMQPTKLLFLLGTLALILFSKKIDSPFWRIEGIKQENRFALTMTVGGYFIGLCLSFLEYFFEYQGRIAWYFLLFECVYFGFLMKAEKKWIRRILFCVILLLSGYSFVYSMLNNSQGVIPYRFFWQ